MLISPLASEVLTPHIVRYRAQESDPSQSWIVDRNTAHSLCDAVDQALGQSSGDYMMAFGSPSFRYVNIFLWPAGTPSPSPLYRLNTMVMLQYITRSSFEWTVHYPSVREYSEAQSAIAGYVEASAMQICTPSPPPAPSYNADVLLDQLVVFDGADASMAAGSVDGGEEFPANFIDASDTVTETEANVCNDDIGMQEPATSAPPLPTSPTVCDSSSLGNGTDAIPDWSDIDKLEVPAIFELIGANNVGQQGEPDFVLPPITFNTEMNVAQTAVTPLSRSYPSPIHQRFPISEFSRHEQLNRQDVKSANYILTKFKILAIAQDFRATARGRRYSLEGEKQAIMSMPLDTSLSINSTFEEHLGISETLRRAFSRYDDGGLTGNSHGIGLGTARGPAGRPRMAERVERGLLLVAVLLLRHSCMYVEPRRNEESGRRVPGQHFAIDFDRRIPQTTAGRRQSMQPVGASRPAHRSSVIRRARTLCRIVVACGHPCIVVILVRLSVRLGIRLASLLDELPLDAFCNWLATGGVSSSHLYVSASTLASGTIGRGERLEWDLRWLHENVLLPLLAVASKGMPDRFSMLDGRVECNAEACLAAIVPHSLQTRYLDFLEGQYRHDEWTIGRVQLSTSPQGVSPTSNGTPTRCSSVVSTPRTVVEEEDDWHQPDRPAIPQYSIATANRTFARTNVAAYADNGQLFDPPPPFLVNQILTLVEDV